MPLYVLGLMGVTRRMSHFEDPSLQIWFQIAAFGAVLIALGIGAFLIQLVVSFLRRDKLRDPRATRGTAARWNGRPRRRRRPTTSPSRRWCTTTTPGTT
jgi:cytochrome o ubiquinol oxidase subunit 1